MRKVYVLVLFIVIGFTSWSQFNINTAATNYTQDFNTLTNGAWADNTTLTGWYARTDLTSPITTYNASTGTSTAGALYAFGVAGVNPLSERALGYASSNAFTGGSGTGRGYIGWRLRNNTGAAISSISVTWTGEQWRKENNASSHNLQLFYQTGATVTSLTAGTWTTASSVFTSPIVGATAATALDGNDIPNRSAGIVAVITVNIPVNEEIMLRWEDLNDVGNDHHLAIDDVTINATAGVANTITTGAVLAPPFILADCSTPMAGTVAFTSTDVYTTGNVFTAQLSNDIGLFTSPVNIGSLPLDGTAPSGIIPIIIPAGTVSGTGYKIRVVSDLPSVTGTESSTFQITQLGACASSHTDFYRSVANGDWSNVTTWESRSSDNPTWIPATLVPSSIANTITIQTGTTVTLTTSQSADQLIIQSGSVLVNNVATSNIFTIADGTGDDMTINTNGTYQIISGNGFSGYQSLGTGATIHILSLGVIQIGNGGGISGGGHNGFAVTSGSFIWDTGAIFEWNNTSFPGLADDIYFPDAVLTIPILRFATAPGAAMGGGTLTQINGALEANASVIFSGNAEYVFRNGILGTGNVTQNTGTGKLTIDGVIAGLGGTGIIIPNANGLEIGSVAGTTVTLISDKSVTGDINLIPTNTIIDVGAFDLTVSGNVNNGNSTSYVRTSGAGNLNLLSVGTKTYPIGNTSYNPLIISNGGNVDYAVRVETGINPAVSFPTYGVLRTWVIRASAVNANVTLTFQYRGADAGALMTPGENMELLLYDGIAWSGVSGNLNIPTLGGDPYTNTTVTGVSIPMAETPYALGKAGGYILAIDCIITARAQKTGNNALITWDINSCAEVTSFELQRSVNGGSFATIGTITPGSPLNYDFTDASLGTGVNLYRVKVNRTSGAIKYSNTVAIINDTKGLLITSLAPNPVHDKTIMTLSAAKQGKISFRVYSISGRLVKQWESSVTEGNNAITLNFGELAAGSYLIEATGLEARTVFRMVKE